MLGVVPWNTDARCCMYPLEGPGIRGESYIKKRNAPAGREIDSVLCLASVELDMPAL